MLPKSETEKTTRITNLMKMHLSASVYNTANLEYFCMFKQTEQF